MSSVYEYIKEQNKYCNIDKLHDKGVTGKGIVVWNCEARTPSHGEITERRILDAAPDAAVITCGYNLVADNKKIYAHTVDFEGKTYDIEDFIYEKKIRILTKSVGGSTAKDGAVSRYWNMLKEKYNLIFFTASGNEGTKRIGGAFPPDVAMLVGACDLVKGNPKRAGYSSVGEDIDFMGFTGIWNGTSFASPYIAGMAALLCQVSPNITQYEVYEYFKDNAVDLEGQGFDNNTGYGLVKMGEIGSVSEMEDEMITKTKIKVNGKILEVNRILKNDENYIRLRDFEDVLGVLNIEWDAKERIPVIIKR